MINSGSEFASAVEELAARVLNGDDADVEEVLKRFPQFESELRDMLSTVAALAEWKSSESPAILPSEDTTAPLRLDRHLGDFRIQRELGRGGMGIVYEAEQTSLQRRVALKVLPFASLINEKQLRRFKNEALAAASLRHPNIVGVYGTGCERSVHFYAMELIDGCDLSQVIQGLQRRSDNTATDGDQMTTAGDHTTAAIAQLSTKRDSSTKEFFRSVAALAEQAAKALHFAHEEGIVHRDVKPANLLLDNECQVHVADFGLARIRLDSELTLSGDLVGTLRYMSPEQVEGQPVDHRTDIYSLGATLYEMVTGKSLFHDEHNRAKLVSRITEANPVHVQQHDASIPNDLATLIHKCLNHSPDERYATAEKLAKDLRRFIESRPIHAKRSGALSKAFRWAKRNRTLATVSLVACTAVTVLAVAGPLVALRLKLGLVNEKRLTTQLANSKSQLELQLYDMRVRSALESLDRAQVGVARDVLTSYQSVPTDGVAVVRSFEYWLLKSKFDKQQRGLFGTSNIDIQELALSPDTNLAALGDWLGNIRLVDRETSRLDRIGKLGDGLEKSTTRVCEFSPDGKLLLVAGGTDTRLWDVARSRWIALDAEERRSEARFVIGGGFVTHGGRVAILLADQDQPYSHDNKSSAAISLYELDVLSERPSLKLLSRRSTETVDLFSMSPTIACGAKRGAGEIRRWTLPELYPLDSVQVNASHLVQVEVHPKLDDLLAVAFSEDRIGRRHTRVELIHADIQSKKQFVANHDDAISCLKFSSDGLSLAAGFHDGQTIVWRDYATHLEDGAFPFETHHMHSGAVQDIELDAEKQMLFTASSDHTARQAFLRQAKAECLPVTGYTTAIEWSNNDQQLVLGGIDNLSLWDVTRKLQTRSKRLTLERDRVNYARDLSLLGDGQRVAFAANAWPASKTGRVGVWNLVTDETTWIFESTRQANEVKQNYDGSLLIAAVGDEMLSFSATDLQLVNRQKFSPRCSVGIHPHQNLIAVTGPGARRDEVSKIVLWNVDHWSQVGEILVPKPKGIDAITFSPDGDRLAADIGDGRVAIWPSWKQHNAPVILSTQADISKLTFSSDGRRIASAGWDGRVRLWNCDTGNELVSFKTTTQWATAVAFSNNGRSLAFGGGIGTKYGTVQLIHTTEAERQ